MGNGEYRYIRREIRATHRSVRLAESMYQDEITSITDTVANGGEMENLKARLDAMEIAGDITTIERDAAKTDADQAKTDAGNVPVFQATPNSVTIDPTPDSYPEIPQLDWKCRRFTEKNIQIKNTGSPYSINFKVNVRTKEDGLDWEEVSEKTLVTGDIYRVHLGLPHERVRIFVKNVGTGEASTGEIDPGGEVN